MQFQRRDGGPFPESSRRGRLEILGQVLDIAIAGAGPAGLATALYLDRFGHRVTLFERFEQPKPIGSGLILQPTGLAVLDDLGLHGEIAALGQPLDAGTISLGFKLIKPDFAGADFDALHRH